MAFALGGAFSPPSAVVTSASGGRISIPIRTPIIPVLSKPFSAALSSSSAAAPRVSRKWRAPASPESLESEAALEPEAEPEPVEVQIAASEASLVPKGEEVFAVVMIGSRQYIVFPGRYIYTQRLKGANANDKIILNKVLLVGTKTKAYIGEPIVTNAAVHAVVEEQGLNNKVVVFKYKRKKNYRRNIGHRQPNTRIRITGISGYQDFPADTMLSVPA